MSKNASVRLAERTAKIVRDTIRREDHEQMLLAHDHHCGHLRINGRPVSRVDVHRERVGA